MSGLDRLVAALPAGEVMVVAPEPAGWLAPLLAALGDRARVWAPWARSGGRAWPGALGRALDRRVVAGARGVPGGALLDVALTRLGADRPAVQYPLAHRRRVALGRLAARAIGDAAAVVAPSFAATAVFAAARDRGAQTVLMHDWPELATLCADLDAALRCHPGDPWLDRFRPPARWIATQRSERVLADRVVVRGRYVAERVRADGVAAERVVMASVASVASVASMASLARRGPVLLVGRGAARAGGHEAAALLDRMPTLRLTGPLGTAAVPALRGHPRFEARAGVDGSTVSAALAPAWVEGHSPLLRAAAERGMPIVATAQAAGTLGRGAYAAVAAGDLGAMQVALDIVAAG